MEKKLLLGPPGTGKTTTLLGIVEDALRDGIDRILIDEMRQPEWRARIEGALGAGAIRPE